MFFSFVSLFIYGIILPEKVQALLQNKNLFAIKTVGDALQFVGPKNATFEICFVNDQGSLTKSVSIATADDIKMLSLTLNSEINSRQKHSDSQQTQINALNATIFTADANLVASITVERERATSIEASLLASVTEVAQSITAEHERVAAIEATTMLNKIESSNAVMQANTKVLEATNYFSAAMAQNKIVNSNAIFQIATTLINSESTAIATQAQIKLDASNAMVVFKSTSDVTLSQMKNIVLQTQSTAFVTQNQIQLENSIAFAASKNASDILLSELKIVSSIAVTQVKNDIISLNTSIVAVDGKFGFLLAPCPNNSFGVGVAAGCTCKAGSSGNVMPKNISPYYTSTCSPVPCPINTTGINLIMGCSYSLPLSGIIVATTIAPYYFFVEFKNSGSFTWVASFTGTLSVIVVGGGGAGGDSRINSFIINSIRHSMPFFLQFNAL